MTEETLEISHEAITVNQSNAHRERVKHFLIGSRKTVKSTINTLHIKGYAEVREWSKPQAAGFLGEPGDVVSVLIRQIVDC